MNWDNEEVELRWVRRVPIGITVPTISMPVLQVRYREGPHGETWWGKWQDVPTINEEDADD